MDGRIMALLSRDIVAAEAHYSRSCYRFYTKQPKATCKPVSDPDPYSAAEDTAYSLLFTYVRTDLFRSPRVIRMAELTGKLTEYITSLGFETQESSRRYIRRRLEADFGDSLCFLNDQRKLLVWPDNLTREDLAKQNMTLAEKLDLYTRGGKDMESVITRAALYLREVVGRASVSQ